MTINKNRLNEFDWLHGEVRFEETNLCSKYLIIPQGVRDINEVLATMCLLWDIQIPELFLAVDGEQNTVCETALEQDMWTERRSNSDDVDEDKFKNAMVSTSQAIAIACSESKTWVYAFDGNYGSFNGDMDGETCSNKAWSYFGQGRRSSAKCESVEFICATRLRGLFCENDFRKHAVPLMNRVETLISYPSMKHRFDRDGKIPSDCLNGINGGIPTHKKSVIWPEFTHILLYDGGEKQAFPDIYMRMKALTTTVHLAFGGVHPSLTNTVVEKSTGVPKIILQYTSGPQVFQREISFNDEIRVLSKQNADEIVTAGNSMRFLKWSNMFPSAIQVSLQAGVEEDGVVIVDIQQDTHSDVIDKFLHVQAYARDREHGIRSERCCEHDQLEKAWNSILCYKYNAEIMFFNSFYMYVIMALPWMTMIGLALKMLFARIHERNSGALSMPWLLGWFVSASYCEMSLIIPLFLSCFSMCYFSTFSSASCKRNDLIRAARRIETEVYRYRTHVVEYKRQRKQTLDIIQHMPKLPEACHYLLRKKYPQRSALDNLKLLQEEASTIYSPRTTNGTTNSEAPILPTCNSDVQLKCFQKTIDQIQLELADCGVHPNCLANPSKQTAGSYKPLMSNTDCGGNPPNKVTQNTENDGFSTLLADDYIRFRVKPTIEDLSRLSYRHTMSIFWLESLRLAACIISVVIGMLQIYALVAMFVACIGLITNILNFHQLSARLRSVNRALKDLEYLVNWWQGLDHLEQKKQYVIEHIVDVTENATYANLLTLRRFSPEPVNAHESNFLADLDGF